MDTWQCPKEWHFILKLMWRNACFSLNLKLQIVVKATVYSSPPLFMFLTAWSLAYLFYTVKDFAVLEPERSRNWQLAPLVPLAMPKSRHSSRKSLKYLWYISVHVAWRLIQLSVVFPCIKGRRHSSVILWRIWSPFLPNFSDFRSHKKNPKSTHNWWRD